MPCSFRGRYLLTELLERDARTASFRAQSREGSGEAQVLVKVARASGPGGAPPGIAKLMRREATMAGLLGEETEAFFGLAGADLGEPPYLAFELVSWPTLRDLLGERGTLSPVDAAQIGVAVLHGLTALERHHLVHRALTPARIFAHKRDDGLGYDVKIAGIGVFSEGAEAGAIGAIDAAILPYASPEMLRAEALGAASDLFMVACVLWELASGAPPFPGADEGSATKAAAQRLRNLERPPTRPADMPAELHALLSSALAVDPRARCPANTPAGSPLASLGGALERFAEEYPERQARELAFARDDLGRVEGLLATINRQLVPLQWVLDQKAAIEAKVLRLAGAGTTPEEVREGAREAEDALEELQIELERCLASSSVAPAPAKVLAAPAPVPAAAKALVAPAIDPSAQTATFLLTQKPDASTPPDAPPSSDPLPAGPAPSRAPPTFSDEDVESAGDDAGIPGVGGARWPYALGAFVLIVVLALIGYLATADTKGPAGSASGVPSASAAPSASASSGKVDAPARSAAPAEASAAPVISAAASASVAPSASAAPAVAPRPRPRPAPPAEEEPAAAPEEAPAPE